MIVRICTGVSITEEVEGVYRRKGMGGKLGWRYARIEVENNRNYSLKNADASSEPELSLTRFVPPHLFHPPIPIKYK